MANTETSAIATATSRAPVKWQPLASPPSLPLRKPNDKGKGQPISLQCNLFEVTVENPNLDLFHYDVDIRECGRGPVHLPKQKRLLIFEEMRKANPTVFKDVTVGFDREKNAFSTEPLFSNEKNQPERNFKVPVREEGRKAQNFSVTLKEANRVNLSALMSSLRASNVAREEPQTVIQMLEVLMQHNFLVRYEKVGRSSFYSTSGEFGGPYDIGGGKNALVGFFCSLRPVGWKDNALLLNIDVVSTAFCKEQSVLDFAKELLGLRESDLNKLLSDSNKTKLSKSLEKMKVQETHTQIHRTYKVVGVQDLGADRLTFPIKTDSGKTVQRTVEEYFRDKHGKRLRYPRLNCLHLHPPSRNIYIPIECLKIPKGEKWKGKLSASEASQLIRKTAKPPRERLQHITQIAQSQQFSKSPAMRSLHFVVSDQPMRLTGHILPPPTLKMNKEFTPDKGVWDTRGKTFYVGETLTCWAVCNYNTRHVSEDDLSEFIGNLMKMGRQRGLTIREPNFKEHYESPNPECDIPSIKEKHSNIQIIMVVLPKSQAYYDAVKTLGDRQVSVMTQCVSDANVRKNQTHVLDKLLLKINAKIEGTNNIVGREEQLLVFESPVMIMGADVSHPPAGDGTTPSLSAVVASIDRYAARYAVEVRHQKHRTEMIQHLKEMTKNLLLAFREATSKAPQRIVMYRDGVSESQFLQVLSSELAAMREACTELHKDYKPAMTFIVVQKKHHTRLSCDKKDGVGTSGNVPPGTTVDDTITHPTQRDFYLCSHQGLMGTSRPAHYYVLWDDSDLPMEILQNLTYALCHLYSRCSRSVSIPTPAYYAHLAADRARAHFRYLCPSRGTAEAYSDAEVARATRMDRLMPISKLPYYV